MDCKKHQLPHLPTAQQSQFSTTGLINPKRIQVSKSASAVSYIQEKCKPENEKSTRVTVTKEQCTPITFLKAMLYFLSNCKDFLGHYACFWSLESSNSLTASTFLINAAAWIQST